MPLDEEGTWYRYHHLFADMLRHRLRQTSPGQVPELHRRAMAWYQDHSLLVEAIDHALAVGDAEQAADMIERVAPISTAWGRQATIQATIQKWIEALPDEVVRKRPQLCLFHAWALSFTDRFADAEPRVQDVEHNIQAYASAMEEQSISSQVTAIRAMVAFRQRNFPRAIELFRQALVLLPEHLKILRIVVASYLGSICFISGDTHSASQAYIQAVAISNEMPNSQWGILAMSYLALLHMLHGQLHQAATLYQQALQCSESISEQAWLITGIAYIGMGQLQYQWNNLEAATDYLDKGLVLSKQTERITELIQGYSALADIAQARREQSEALRLMEEMKQWIAERPGVDDPFWTHAQIADAEAYLWIVQGNVEPVVRWAQENGMSTDTPVGYQQEFQQLVFVRVLMAQERLNEAMQLLTRMLADAETSGRMTRVIEMLVLASRLEQLRRNSDEAMQTLERALSLAEPEGYIRIFLDEGLPIATLLSKMRDLHGKGCSATTGHFSLAYVDKLLATFAANGIVVEQALLPSVSTCHAPSPLLDILSERELEVLRLIVAGLSNREIAAELVIALSTVKWYINIIYSKLQVESRAKAIARAHVLNLVVTPPK